MSVQTPGSFRTLLQSEINLLEHRAEIYEKWKARGVFQRIFLQLDAYPDLGWLPDSNSSETIRNSYQARHGTPFKIHSKSYLYQAFQERMIRKWIWAIPTPIWNLKEGREKIGKDLSFLFRTREGNMTKPVWRQNHFETSFFGVETWIAGFQELPHFQEPVVLNIDMAFLTTRNFQKPPAEPLAYRRQIPWLWPEELLTRFQEKNIQILSASITNSIQEGFTPIRFKFLGQVLKDCFATGQVPEGYKKLKHAFLLRRSGKNVEAIDVLTTFQADGDLENARCYLLATILAEDGCFKEAQPYFQACGRRDPDYQSLFNSSAKVYEDWGMTSEAYQEYQMIRALNPGFMEARVGEAKFEMARGRFEHAERLFQEILAQNSEHSDSFYGLGLIEVQNEKFREALDYFEKVIQINPEHLLARAHAAESAAILGDYDKARVHFKEALHRGLYLPQIYLGLGKVYWAMGQKKKAFKCFTQFFRLKVLGFWRKKHFKRTA